MDVAKAAIIWPVTSLTRSVVSRLESTRIHLICPKLMLLIRLVSKS